MSDRLMFVDVPLHLVTERLLEPAVPVLQVEPQQLLSLSVEQGSEGPHREEGHHEVGGDADQSKQEVA